MTKIIAKVDGMMCGMCESHINDVVRKTFPAVKKVSSSHSRGETEILTEEDITDEALRSAIDPTGYTFVSARREMCAQKGLFARFKK